MQAFEARKGIEVRMLKATCSAHLAKKDHNDKIEGFVAVSESIVCVGRLKRICKDALCGAGAVQETSLSEIFGCQGADVLGGVAFWSIRSSALLS